VIEAHEQKGRFQRMVSSVFAPKTPRCYPWGTPPYHGSGGGGGGLLGVSSSLAQETSIRARIKSAEKRIIERVVFIEFWLVEFTILSQIE
jgi:hypothetical protein